MNDILKSAAYQEFLQKSCEEITANDEGYQKLMLATKEAYKQLEKSFSNFINLSTKLQVYSEGLMLRSELNTAQYTAQSLINHDYDVIDNNEIVHYATKD
jgi:hypothetical protein